VLFFERMKTHPYILLFNPDPNRDAIILPLSLMCRDPRTPPPKGSVFTIILLFRREEVEDLYFFSPFLSFSSGDGRL